MSKFIALILSASVALAACGPAPQPPVDSAQPPPATAPAQPTPAPAPAEQPAPPPRAEAPRPRPAPVRETAPVRQRCESCGVIAAVNEERVKGEAGYVGTLGGAGAGALAGSQFGKKSGKFAMMALGALGGALAGREVEKQVTAKTVYRVTVDMSEGGQRVITVPSLNGMGVGSKVRVVGNSLESREG